MIPGVLNRDNSVVRKVCELFLEEWPITANEPPQAWKAPLLKNFLKSDFLLKGRIEGVNYSKEIYASIRVVLGKIYLITNKYDFSKMTDNSFVTTILNGTNNTVEIEFDGDNIIEANDGATRKALLITSFKFGTLFYDFTSFQEAFHYEIKTKK